MKAPTAKQIAARERFAEMARSGAFKRKARKTTPKKRARNPIAAGEFFVKSGNEWITGRTRTGGWSTAQSFAKALPLTAEEAAGIKSHCDRTRIACQVVPVEVVDFAASTPGELSANPKARKSRAAKPIKRASQTTGKTPSARLVKRRRATAKGPAGYFANPSEVQRAHLKRSITPPFMVTWFPVNQAWALTWGEQIIAVSVGSRASQRLFESRADLVDALRARGLTVNKGGHVTGTLTVRAK